MQSRKGVFRNLISRNPKLNFFTTAPIIKWIIHLQAPCRVSVRGNTFCFSSMLLQYQILFWMYFILFVFQWSIKPPGENGVQVEFLIWSPEWDCRWLYVVTIQYKAGSVTYCFSNEILGLLFSPLFLELEMFLFIYKMYINI